MGATLGKSYGVDFRKMLFQMYPQYENPPCRKDTAKDTAGSHDCWLPEDAGTDPSARRE